MFIFPNIYFTELYSTCKETSSGCLNCDSNQEEETSKEIWRIVKIMIHKNIQLSSLQ